MITALTASRVISHINYITPPLPSPHHSQHLLRLTPLPPPSPMSVPLSGSAERRPDTVSGRPAGIPQQVSPSSLPPSDCLHPAYPFLRTHLPLTPLSPLSHALLSLSLLFSPLHSRGYLEESINISTPQTAIALQHLCWSRTTQDAGRILGQSLSHLYLRFPLFNIIFLSSTRCLHQYLCHLISVNSSVPYQTHCSVYKPTRIASHFIYLQYLCQTN
jgi:hypothetical protein